jgi:polyisoprenyl-phosphate glycosyltransferase
METDVSIVIPVYKSGEWIGELTAQIAAVLREAGKSHEIILVDDCSPDESWSGVCRAAAEHPCVKGLQLMVNEGQPKATLCGLAHACGRTIVTMDDDFQHPPDQIPKLLTALEAHPEIDCVLGYFDEKQHARYRNWASAVIRRVNAMSYRLPKGTRSSGFRAMRRQLAEAIVAHRTLNPAIPVLLFGSTRRVLSIPVEHARRRAGKSNYTLRRQFRLAFDNICYASMLPLRAVSALGIGACGLSVILMAVFLLKYAMGLVKEPGWTTLVLLLTFFSGTILLAVGVIGEYMVRILREVRQRPQYFIRQTAGAVPSSPAAQVEENPG